MKTHWSDERLRNLFKHYNQRYWRGRLSRYRVIQSALSENHCDGYCDLRRKKILIDPAGHNSDRDLRATLLHEMAHAASRKPGHGVGFFAQMERLIRLGAPVTVDSPEAGNAQILAEIVPRRFPKMRAKMERVEKKRQRDVIAQAQGLPFTDITDEMIVARFEDALELKWKNALLAVGLENGLVDETGRPLTAHAKRLIAKGRKVHGQARRAHVEAERHWQQILGQPCVSESTELRDEASQVSG
jgi:hypothetical protein